MQQSIYLLIHAVLITLPLESKCASDKNGNPQILRGGDGTAEDDEDAGVGINLFSYFSGSCYSGYSKLLSARLEPGSQKNGSHLIPCAVGSEKRADPFCLNEEEKHYRDGAAPSGDK